MSAFNCSVDIKEGTGGHYIVDAKDRADAAKKVFVMAKRKVINMVKRGYFSGVKTFNYEIFVADGVCGPHTKEFEGKFKLN